MSQIDKNKLKISIAGIMLISAFCIYFAFNPEETEIFPPCPFHYLTGYDCPGCGSQRALHSILHLKLYKAATYNPLMVLFIPYITIGLYMNYLGGKDRFPRTRKFLFGSTAIKVIFVIIILYWIGRNAYKYI